MDIAVGSDHAGYEDPPPHYKPELMTYLGLKGFNIINCGTDTSDAVDYPDVADAVCEKVLSGKADLGLLICGSGIGMSISANRLEGIRAAVCTTPEMARLSRQHNHSNVLCLGRRLLSTQACKEILEAWLDEPYSQESRHLRRVIKMG